ncbi:MAG: RIP metalloprotease RseP [Pseudomonadota bacterium]
MLELIASIPLVGGLLATVLPFVVVLGIVVFVHEYGHYIVGRWCGIKAEVFSLGFGPVLTSWIDRHGTRWQVAALPLGGYVKFVGDVDGSSRGDPKILESLSPDAWAHAFHGAAVWKRMLTVLAGPVFNFILSAVMFAVMFSWQGVVKSPPTIGEIVNFPEREQIDIAPGDVVRAVEGQDIERFGDLYRIVQELGEVRPIQLTIEREGRVFDTQVPYPLPPMVFGVEPLSPASRAGLEIGDYILSANGKTLNAFEDLRTVVMAAGDTRIPLSVWRDGEVLDLSIMPTLRAAEDGDGGFEERVMIGVAGGSAYIADTRTPAPWSAAWMGVEQVWTIIKLTVNGLAHIISGDISAKNIQGPIGIAQISGESATQGWGNFWFLIGLISTTIGLLNLFPIPILDGGHLVIFTYEAITGRPPADSVLQVAMSIGLAMVLLLMVFATYNDVMRLLFVS